VLDSDVDAFRDDPLADLLVDDDADGAGVDVEDAAGSAVVEFVGHALVDGAIDNDIDDVTNSVGGEGFSDVDSTLLSEAFSEFMSGSSPLAVAVGHGNK
jgi:hypothetical protein